MRDRDSNLVRVRFRLDPSEWNGSLSEGLWASPLKENDGGGVYVLLNSPFFYSGVSNLDVVEARMQEDGLYFSQVIDRGRHSTYRIYCRIDGEDAMTYREHLVTLGCSFERADLTEGVLYSVDIPPEVDIHQAYGVMSRAQAENIFVFEAGFLAHEVE